MVRDENYDLYELPVQWQLTGAVGHRFRHVEFDQLHDYEQQP